MYRSVLSPFVSQTSLKQGRLFFINQTKYFQINNLAIESD